MGLSVQQIAQGVKVEEKTVYKWLNEKEYENHILKIMEAESTLTVNVGSFGLNEHIKTQPYWIYLYQYVKIIN